MRGVVQARPAETAGATVGFGGIVAGIAAHNPLAAALAASGLVPGAVTFVVAHGGVRGVLGALWRGQDETGKVAVLESKTRRTKS